MPLHPPIPIRNIRFRYRCQSPLNKKNYGAFVLQNPANRSIQEITAQLWSALMDRQYFTPSHLSVPVLCLFPFYVEKGTICYEFLGIDLTDQPTTDVRTVDEFMCELL